MAIRINIPDNNTSAWIDNTSTFYLPLDQLPTPDPFIENFEYYKEIWGGNFSGDHHVVDKDEE